MGNISSKKRKTIALVSIDIQGLPLSTFHIQCNQKAFLYVVEGFKKNIRDLFNVASDEYFTEEYMCRFEIESVDYSESIIHYESVRQPVEMKSLALKTIVGTVKQFSSVKIISV